MLECRHNDFYKIIGLKILNTETSYGQTTDNKENLNCRIALKSYKLFMYEYR